MEDLDIVGRAAWGAEPPLSKMPLTRPIAYLKTSTVPNASPCYTKEECIKEMKAIQHTDMYDDKQHDIRANFYIGDDGKVYEGRGWFSRPVAHSIGQFDGKYIEIAYIGGGEDKQASREFTQIKEKLLKFAVKKKFLNEYHTLI